MQYDCWFIYPKHSTILHILTLKHVPNRFVNLRTWQVLFPIMQLFLMKLCVLHQNVSNKINEDVIDWNLHVQEKQCVWVGSSPKCILTFNMMYILVMGAMSFFVSQFRDGIKRIVIKTDLWIVSIHLGYFIEMRLWHFNNNKWWRHRETVWSKGVLQSKIVLIYFYLPRMQTAHCYHRQHNPR